jgi:hypothetical protein
MINLLMRNPSIVLQHVVVLCSGRSDQFLYYGLLGVSSSSVPPRISQFQTFSTPLFELKFPDPQM